MLRLVDSIRIVGWLAVTIATVGIGLRSDRAFRSRESGSRVEVRIDIPYRSIEGGRKLELDVYLPPTDVPRPIPGPRRPAILMIHGGSWIGGSKRLLRPSPWEPRPTALRLAEAGYLVVAADYRLARPGSPSWPTPADDLREAVRWIRRQADELGLDPDRIAALGQSAGAHLAEILATPDDPASRIQAVVAFYGPSNLESLPSDRIWPLAHEPVDSLLGSSVSAREASPVHRVLPSTAPILLIHGTADHWVPIAQSEEMAETLREAGVRHRLIRVEGARHGFEAEVGEPRRLDLLPAILDFLRVVWNASGGPQG